MSYEVRVWREDSTLMGYAEVAPLGKRWNVSVYADLTSGYARPDIDFKTQAFAESYAHAWAEEYADWCRENCPCGTGDCGVMFEHGISIQYCRDGWTTDQGAD